MTLLADRRLELLYEVSQLLAGLESIEVTLDAVLRLVAQALPLQSAILIDARLRQARMIVWTGATYEREVIQSAKGHARAAYAYLVGTSPDALQIVEQLRPTSFPNQSIQLDSKQRYIVIPLIAGGQPIFGALQFEGAQSFGEADLIFVNAISNQLAIAIDRHYLWQRDIAQRERAEEGRIEAEERAATADLQRATAEGLTERYEALVDNLDRAIVWEAGAETFQVSYVSARAEKLLGYTRQEWMNAPNWWKEHVPPDDWKIIRATVDRALAERQDQRCEHRIWARDGRVLWFHTGVHIAEAHSNDRYVQGVSIDVTPAKEAEERVREQLAFIHAMTVSLGEGVVAVDLRGRVTFLNHAAEAILGCSRESALGRDLEEIMRIRDLDRALDADFRTQVAESGTPIRRDKQVAIRNDGTKVPLSYAASPIRREGKVTGAVLAFEDITERARSDEAKLLLLDASTTASESLDYVSVLRNLAMRALPRLGDACLVHILTRDNELERIVSAHIDPDGQTVLDEVFENAARAESSHPVLRAIATGEPQPVSKLGESNSSALTVPMCLGKRRLGALTFVYAEAPPAVGQGDLELAQELANRAAFALENGLLYEQARRAVQVREQVLAVVSHDLKNPLHAILLTADLLAQRGQTEERREEARRLQRAAKRMHRIINDLLDFASIESGQLQVSPAPEQPTSIVAEAIESLDALAKDRGHRLLSEVEPELPVLECDRQRILQVISNLAGNAIKIMARGGVVTIRVVSREGEVMFSVTDTGPGISAPDMQRIFERYWRSGEARYQGTGLGLAISRGIVDAHHGRIWAESELGKGATFFFTLPCSE